MSLAYYASLIIFGENGTIHICIKNNNKNICIKNAYIYFLYKLNVCLFTKIDTARIPV